MARRKKDASNGALENLEIDVPDVTAAVMPEGTPTSADGSISEGDDISVEQARKIGAIDTASAQHNRRVARTIHKKISGQPVRWNEQDAIMAFDNVKRAFDPSTLWIVIQRKEPGVPDEDYQPILMSSFKDSSGLYDHVLRKIHKNRPATTYLVRFKDGGGQRTQGFLRMPDTTSDPIEQKGPDMQQGQPPYPPIPLPGYGYPPPGQQYPQQQYPYGYQPPPQGYPQQPPQQGYNGYPQQPQVQPAPVVPPAPAPVAAPVAQQPVQPQAPVHENHYYQPPPPPQRDPGLDAAVATTYKELQDTKQMMQQTLLQNERLIGELMEMRRTQLADAQRQQMQPPAPQTQPQQPPLPPVVMTPYGPQPPPNGYGPPPQQQQYAQPPNGQPAYGAHVPMAAPQRHVDPQYAQPPYNQPPQQQYGQQPQQYGPPPQQYAPQAPQAAPQGWGNGNGAPAPAQQPQRGWGPPQPGVSGPPQQQSSQDLMGQFSNTMGQAVTMISGMTRAMAEIQRTVGNSTQVNPPPEDDYEDDLPNIPPPPPDQPKPFHTMPLGFGEGAPVYAYNEDGSPNVTGMILGNVPKAGAWLRSIGDGVASVLKARNAGGAGAVGQLPEAVAQPVYQQPVQQQQQYVQPQQAPAPSAPAPKPAAPSMMPSLASIRQAIGQP